MEIQMVTVVPSLKIHELKHNRREKTSKIKYKSKLKRSRLEENEEDKVIKWCNKKDWDETSNFACTLCDKYFASLKALNFHIKKHSLRKKLKCPNCNKGFPSLKTYTNHTQRGILFGYSCRKKFKCLLCEKVFLSETLLSKHASLKSFHCSICIKTFMSCKEVKDHKKDHILRCIICNCVFSQKSELKQHQLSHDIEELNCSICSKKFTSLEALSRHTYRVHMVKKNVQCKFCKKLFHKRVYDVHLRTHTGERPYECEECDSTFVQKNHLVKHMKTHCAKNGHKCDVCGTLFSTNWCLRLHTKMHTDEELDSCNIPVTKYDISISKEKEHHQRSHLPSERHACKICGKEYSFIHLIYSHYRKHSQEDLHKLDLETLNTIYKTKSGNERKMKCNFCSKTFLRFFEVQEHIRQFHSEEKRHKCSTCGKVFGLKHNLRLHERIHKNQKSFACKLCGKAFIRKDHAKSHMVVHTEEKPYECDICGKSFARRSYFLSHKRSHSVDLQESPASLKNYSYCSGCSKGFKARRKYTKHLEKCPRVVDNTEVEELPNTSIEIVEHLEREVGEKPIVTKNALIKEIFDLECADIAEIRVPDIECMYDASLDSKVDFMVHIIEESESVFPGVLAKSIIELQHLSMKNSKK
ncbi:zinc finger protein 600-like [Palaemon carinicauda]|uniref:zinc finger protein 600-like n=1 Tax=Palaemon carinicauda TaxID=392227 RepID=UPI0035B63D2E